MGRKRIYETEEEKAKHHSEYVARYLKDRTKRIAFTLRLNEDKEIIEHLKKQKNMTIYLRELIEKDIKK